MYCIKIKLAITIKCASINLNGASDRNRTGILALARPYTNRCTTPAFNGGPSRI